MCCVKNGLNILTFHQLRDIWVAYFKLVIQHLDPGLIYILPCETANMPCKPGLCLVIQALSCSSGDTVSARIPVDCYEKLELLGCVLIFPLQCLLLQ